MFHVGEKAISTFRFKAEVGGWIFYMIPKNVSAINVGKKAERKTACCWRNESTTKIEEREGSLDQCCQLWFEFSGQNVIRSCMRFFLLEVAIFRLIWPFHFKQLATLLRSSSVRLGFLTYIFLWHSNEFVMTLLFFSRAPKNQIEFASAYQFVLRCKRDFYLTMKPELF